MTRSNSMLKRFPQAALWRWPRPGLFGFSVCDMFSPFYGTKIVLKTRLILCTADANRLPVSDCDHWRSKWRPHGFWATLSSHAGRGTVCLAGYDGFNYFGFGGMGYLASIEDTRRTESDSQGSHPVERRDLNLRSDEGRFTAPPLFSIARSRAPIAASPPLTSACTRAAGWRRSVQLRPPPRSRRGEEWRCDRKSPPPKRDRAKYRELPSRWSGSVPETAPEFRI